LTKSKNKKSSSYLQSPTTLESVCTVSAGNPAPSKKFLTKNAIPFVRVSDLSLNENMKITMTKNSISKENANKLKLKTFPAGSIIFPKSGMSLKLNRRGILAQDSYVVSHLAVLIPKNILNMKWLFYYLMTIDMSDYSPPSSFPSVSLSKIKQIPVYPPNKNIQKEIVSIFDIVIDLQLKKNQILDFFNNLIQSVFYNFFGTPQKLVESKKNYKLSEVSEIRSGITMNKKRRSVGNKVSYITVRNLYREKFNLSDLRTISVSTKDLEKWCLEYGDLCILEGGDRDDVGRTAVYQNQPKPCVHQNHIFRVRLDKKKFNPFFVSAFLNSELMRSIFFKKAKATTGISSINKSQLENLEIPFVDIKKQNLFANSYLKIHELSNIANHSKFENLFDVLSYKFYRN